MIAIVAITENGKKLARRLNLGFSLSAKKIGGSAIFCGGKNKIYFPPKGALKDLMAEIFDKDKFVGIIFIMALGIVVRLIAPYLKNKYCDPAVVVVDEAGRFAISTVSGHEGGANKLAINVSNILFAEPVITTASEVIKNFVIGIGCRRGAKKEEIMRAVKFAVSRTRCSVNKIRCVATIDLKKNEYGLRKACLELGIPLKIVSNDLVRSFNGSYNRSSFVKKKIGIEGVSEPCALLTARRPKLILPKQKVGRVTVAVARES